MLCRFLQEYRLFLEEDLKRLLEKYSPLSLIFDCQMVLYPVKIEMLEVEIKRIALILGVCLFLDAMWLGYQGKYHAELFAQIQKSPLTIRFLPALAVYILIALAVWYFVFQVPATSVSTNPAKAFVIGATLGFSMYGLYDLTNYATLKGYTLQMTLTDMAWGTFLCGTAAGVTAYLLK